MYRGWDTEEGPLMFARRLGRLGIKGNPTPFENRPQDGIDGGPNGPPRPFPIEGGPFNPMPVPEGPRGPFRPTFNPMDYGDAGLTGLGGVNLPPMGPPTGGFNLRKPDYTPPGPPNSYGPVEGQKPDYTPPGPPNSYGPVEGQKANPWGITPPGTGGFNRRRPMSRGRNPLYDMMRNRRSF